MTVEHEHSFELFGTRVRVLVGSGADPALGALRVRARLRRLHLALTRFDPASELSLLNARGGEPVEVSETMVHAVRAALEAARLSGGLVDPTLLPELERAGYATSRVGVTPESLARAIAAAPSRRPAHARSPGAWRDIALDPIRRTVRLPSGVRLDLGGSAKGMAVDVAAAMLAGHPVFAVDAGGDMRLGGTRPVLRTVGVADPFAGDLAHTLALRAGAVATSGLGTRLWRTRDGYAHHLLDPSRGTPAWTGVVQATALAPSALEAETLAKTALLSGPEAGLAVLERFGGLLVLDDGELVRAGDPGGEAAA